jgi:hypothetical protein
LSAWPKNLFFTIEIIFVGFSTYPKNLFFTIEMILVGLSPEPNTISVLSVETQLTRSYYQSKGSESEKGGGGRGGGGDHWTIFSQKLFKKRLEKRWEKSSSEDNSQNIRNLVNFFKAR